jgi:hypothetical protein
VTAHEKMTPEKAHLIMTRAAADWQDAYHRVLAEKNAILRVIRAITNALEGATDADDFLRRVVHGLPPLDPDALLKERDELRAALESIEGGSGRCEDHYGNGCDLRCREIARTALGISVEKKP